MRLIVRDINGNTIGAGDAEVSGQIWGVVAKLSSTDTIIVTVDYDPDPDE